MPNYNVSIVTDPPKPPKIDIDTRGSKLEELVDPWIEACREWESATVKIYPPEFSNLHQLRFEDHFLEYEKRTGGPRNITVENAIPRHFEWLKLLADCRRKYVDAATDTYLAIRQKDPDALSRCAQGRKRINLPTLKNPIERVYNPKVLIKSFYGLWLEHLWDWDPEAKNRPSKKKQKRMRAAALASTVGPSNGSTPGPSHRSAPPPSVPPPSSTIPPSSLSSADRLKGLRFPKRSQLPPTSSSNPPSGSTKDPIAAAPIDPDTPTQPSALVKPVASIHSDHPISPGSSIELDAPLVPSAPIVPDTPLAPSAPNEHNPAVKPVAPIGSSIKLDAPVAPSAPIMPDTPLVPSAPNKHDPPVKLVAPIGSSIELDASIAPSAPIKPSAPTERVAPVQPAPDASMRIVHVPPEPPPTGYVLASPPRYVASPHSSAAAAGPTHQASSREAPLTSRRGVPTQPRANRASASHHASSSRTPRYEVPRGGHDEAWRERRGYGGEQGRDRYPDWSRDGRPSRPHHEQQAPNAWAPRGDPPRFPLDQHPRHNWLDREPIYPSSPPRRERTPAPRQQTGYKPRHVARDDSPSVEGSASDNDDPVQTHPAQVNMAARSISDGINAVAANLFSPPPTSFLYPWGVDAHVDMSDDVHVDFDVWFCLVVEIHPDESSEGPLWPFFQALSPFGLVAMYRRKGDDRDDQREWVYAFKSQSRMEKAHSLLAQRHLLPVRVLNEHPATKCFTSILDWRYVAAVYHERELTPAMRSSLLARAPRQWMAQKHALDSISGPTYRGVMNDVADLIKEQGRKSRHVYDFLDIFDGRHQLLVNVSRPARSTPPIVCILLSHNMVLEYLLDLCQAATMPRRQLMLWRLRMVLMANILAMVRLDGHPKKITMPLWRTDGDEVDLLRAMAERAAKEVWAVPSPERFDVVDETLAITSDHVRIAWRRGVGLAPVAPVGDSKVPKTNIDLPVA